MIETLIKSFKDKRIDYSNGYIRFYTDEEGKLDTIEDEWFSDFGAEQYFIDVGLDEISEMDFQAESLILITFKIKVEENYSYYDGTEYEEYLSIENTIVLENGYNHDEHYYYEERDEVEEQVFMEWRPFG